jgi:lipopolysaccharide transport protein LptA
MVQFIPSLLNLRNLVLILVAYYSVEASAVKKTVQEVEVKSKKLFVHYGQNMAEYIGGVHIKYNGSDIYCDKALVFYTNQAIDKSKKDKGLGSSILNEIKFYGNVLIDSKENKAYSDYGVFTKNNNLVVLEENVRLKDKKGQVMGSRLVYNVKTKKMQLVNKHGNKRVKAIISE